MSPRLANFEKSAERSPKLIGESEPARQAHSHCASVGSVKRKRPPVRSVSHRQNAIACRHDTRTTGWSAPLAW